MPPRKLDLQPMGAHQSSIDRQMKAEYDRRHLINPANKIRECVDCGVACSFSDGEFEYCRTHAPAWMFDSSLPRPLP